MFGFCCNPLGNESEGCYHQAISIFVLGIDRPVMKASVKEDVRCTSFSSDADSITPGEVVINQLIFDKRNEQGADLFLHCLPLR